MKLQASVDLSSVSKNVDLKKKIEDFSQSMEETKIFIATPCYGFQTYVNYVNSLLAFIGTPPPEDLKYTTSFHVHAGGALVSHARNDCVNKFMESGCDKLLFIDADIGFKPDDIWRLLRKNVDIALAPYVTKSLMDVNESKFILGFESEEKLPEPDRDGFVRIKTGPAGFMMIDKSVFPKLAEHYPDKISNMSQIQNGKLQTSENYFTFFDCITSKTKGSLGEDISFCKRWTDIGGEIYCDLYAALTHYGTYSFQGQLAQSDPRLRVNFH